MKPHLKRSGGYWQHIGQGRVGYGLTPASAYAQWLAIRPDRVAPPQPKKLKRAKAERELTKALERWEPGTAH